MSERQNLESVALSKLSCDEFDELQRPALKEVGFEKILQQAITRRYYSP